MRRPALPSYRILKHDSSETRIIKIGFSWPALILNLIWLVANGLWLGATLVFVLIGGGLLLFGAAVEESPIAAGAIGLLGGIGLLLFLGFRGNDWLASQLESRGYRHARTVEATNFENAFELADSDRPAE
jgi:hypothetical protein